MPSLSSSFPYCNIIHNLMGWRELKAVSPLREKGLSCHRFLFHDKHVKAQRAENEISDSRPCFTTKKCMYDFGYFTSLGPWGRQLPGWVSMIPPS